MDATLLESAKAEERRLLAELRKNPTFRMYEAVRSVVEAYEGIGQVGYPTISQTPPTDPSQYYAAKQPRRRAESLSTRVANAAHEYLQQKGRRAQSAELVNMLEAKGFELAGHKPTAVVASILSHSPMFDNVKGQGYGLAAWSGGLAPGPGSASERSSENAVDTDPRGTSGVQTATPLSGVAA